MDLVALQEIGLRGTGSIRKSKFTLHYSTDDVKHGYQGAGFTVSKKVSRSVLRFSPICDRICTLRIKGKFHNITFVNVYAPTEDAEDETADEFYETLQVVCDEIPKHDGLRLVQYATISNFKVLSTWFPRKDIHKGTCKIAGTNDTNHTDHILVSKRWASDIKNIRTYTGANSDSDHFLDGARLKHKIALMTRNRTENRKRWNVDRLNETWNVDRLNETC